MLTTAQGAAGSCSRVRVLTSVNAIALVRTQHIVQLLRHGDRDVEVGACQKLGSRHQRCQ